MNRVIFLSNLNKSAAGKILQGHSICYSIQLINYNATLKDNDLQVLCTHFTRHQSKKHFHPYMVYDYVAGSWLNYSYSASLHYFAGYKYTVRCTLSWSLSCLDTHSGTFLQYATDLVQMTFLTPSTTQMSKINKVCWVTRVQQEPRLLLRLLLQYYYNNYYY